MKSWLVATVVVFTLFLPGSVRAIEPNEVICWGDDSKSQCRVPEPNRDFRAVSGGYKHSLGLKLDGSIAAWGDATYGQNNLPVPNTGFTAISDGYYHSLGLKQDSSIVSWGSTTSVPSPNTGFKAIAAGAAHSLALKTDGSIVAWGRTTEGQCDVPSPNADFVAIAVGWYHSLGVKSNGSIVAWGRTTEGQCNVPSPNTGFVAVAGGGYHSLGLKSDGSIVAWGQSTDGKCNVPSPNTGFTAIAAGAGHSLGLKSDGSIRAWGWNLYGQCNIPLPNTGYKAVAAGYGFSLAIKGPDSNVPDVNGAIEFKGMSYCGWSEYAYSTEDSNISLARLRDVNCQWVSINVWEFQDTLTSTVIAPDYTLFSVRPESVKAAVDRCHGLGMKVMLKPMLDSKTGEWRAYINPSPEWFAAYRGFINRWADFAEQNNCEMFCIGCEFENSSSHSDEWRSVAAEVRARYSGPIIYAVNHDGVNAINWWDAVDYIGIDAYYALTGENNPTLDELKASWNNIANNIESWRDANWPNKKIIFPEVGYGSYDGSNMTPWAWHEGAGDPTPVDLNEQADCYEVLFSVCSTRDWWGGAFWWNWETDPNYNGRQGRDYSPQNKPAEDVLRKYYGAFVGDLDGDKDVDIDDLRLFTLDWLETVNGWPDFNNDHVVDFRDFSLLASNWQ